MNDQTSKRRMKTFGYWILTAWTEYRSTSMEVCLPAENGWNASKRSRTQTVQRMSKLCKYEQWRRRLLLSLCDGSWGIAAIWQISDSGHFLFSLFMVVMRSMRAVETHSPSVIITYGYWMIFDLKTLGLWLGYIFTLKYTLENEWYSSYESPVNQLFLD